MRVRELSFLGGVRVAVKVWAKVRVKVRVRVRVLLGLFDHGSPMLSTSTCHVNRVG